MQSCWALALGMTPKATILRYLYQILVSKTTSGPNADSRGPPGGGTWSGKGYRLRSDRWRAVAVTTRDG